MDNEMETKVQKAVLAISKAKITLIRKAAKTGIYENFGDKEQCKLLDTHWEVLGSYASAARPARNAFQRFCDWCATYTGR